MEALVGRGVYLLLIHDLDTRWGVSGQRHAPAALLPPGKEPPVPIVKEAGWAPEPVWTVIVMKERSSFRIHSDRISNNN
jgi:hypothetical protein